MKNSKADISLIRKYLNGELDSRAMYRLEREAQDDPMLMDMIQGMETGNREADERTLRDIDQLIINRVAAAGKSRKMTSWKGWIAAASLVLIGTIAGLWIFRTPQQDKLRKRQTEQAGRLGKQAGPDTADIVKEGSSFKNKDQSFVARSPQLKNPVIHKSGSNKPEIAFQNTVVRKNPAVQDIPDSAVIAGLAGAGAAVDMMNNHEGLSEVVVTAYGAQRKRAARSAAIMEKSDTPLTALASKAAPLPLKLGKAHPVVGWDAYQKYLKDNATLPSGERGSVTVVFLIESDGSPAHVIVIKGMNKEADRKAADLILQGSKWTGDQEEIDKMITIKIKFH